MHTDISHAEMVAALCKQGADIIHDLTPHSAHLLHMAVGLCGESGELIDAVKKHAVYNRPLDCKNVIEELGDLEFYMEGLRQALNITRDDTLRANTDKLAIRYNAGRYTNQQAQVRADKV